MTWTELDYRWAVVLWKGREILCRCPVPKLLLNAQERSVIFNWVYHMNLRWVGTYARVCAVMVISSSNHGDQIHQNIVKIVRMMLLRTSNLRRMIVKSEKVRSPNKWKVCLFVIFSIYDTTWNLKPVSKEEFQSSAFLGLVCQKIFEIFVLDSSEKVVRWKISLPTSDLQNRQCKVQKWFVTYKSWAKIFKTLIHSV
jgi:hypothetical protein